MSDEKIIKELKETNKILVKGFKDMNKILSSIRTFTIAQAQLIKTSITETKNLNRKLALQELNKKSSFEKLINFIRRKK